MRVHVLQHVAFEGLGCIADWLEARHATITCTRFFESPQLPALDDVDFVIALGGPMSVNDEAALPWLRDEKRFLADAIAAGKPVLGICLGAQLMASALGARVYPGREKEIGWFPVFAEPTGAFNANDPNACVLPAQIDVFHWHGETFDLPPTARLLAHSAVCRHQAFQIGRRAIGLQFHLETTPASLESMLTHCADELVAGQRFIADAATIRATPAEHYRHANQLMYQLLDQLTTAP